MDGQAFARQLSAWLDPLQLLWRAGEYARNPAGLEERRTETRHVSSFSRASEVGLDWFVRTFVDNFELSADALALVGGATGLSLDDRAVARLSGLRFTGDVSFEGFDASSPPGTVVAFTGPRIEILAIAGPINFLLGLVDQIAARWLPLPRDKAFYEPSFHTELAVYIEASVARALGFRVDSAWTSGRPGKNTRLINGTVTMVGSPPFDRRRVAEAWAADRRRPVPSPRDVSAAGTPAVFDDGDGLVLLDPADAAQPWRNIERFRNECSPLSGVEAPAPRTDGKLLLDLQYGRAFDFVLTEESAVYGFSEDLAKTSPSADLGYLRVPYRAVPRIRVRSRAELDAILGSARSQLAGSFVEGRLLLRGQSQEYFLRRSPGARKALYGDPEALEPSLPASALRKKQPLEDALPEWCLLIRSYLFKLQSLFTNEGPPAEREVFARAMTADRRRLESTLDNHTLAFSLAQHYGLPSMGLDLTDQVETALFFALHQFERGEGRRLRITRTRAQGSVLYVFGLPERFCVEHARARPRVFPPGRPDTQVAWFSHMGWGYRQNQCAEYLAAALYLDPDFEPGPLPSAEELFPPPPQDAFGSFMESVLAETWASPALRRYLEQLYWLET